MNAAHRARLASVAVLAIVFGSGILVGLALHRQATVARAEGVTEVRDDSDRPRAYLFDRVDPTAEQRARIDSIVEAYQDDLRQFHRESRRFYDDGTRALVLKAREAIMGVLDAEQAARYDSIAAARDRRNEGGRNDGNESGKDRK